MRYNYKTNIENKFFSVISRLHYAPRLFFVEQYTFEITLGNSLIVPLKVFYFCILFVFIWILKSNSDIIQAKYISPAWSMTLQFLFWKWNLRHIWVGSLSNLTPKCISSSVFVDGWYPLVSLLYPYVWYCHFKGWNNIEIQTSLDPLKHLLLCEVFVSFQDGKYVRWRHKPWMLPLKQHKIRIKARTSITVNRSCQPYRSIGFSYYSFTPPVASLPTILFCSAALV